MNLKEIAKDYNDAFGFNVIPLENKAPRFEWKKYQNYEMESADIDKLNWNSNANGIGAISGISELRCLDFDLVQDNNFVYNIAEDLGLPQKYSWIVKSGSGKGYHIWFRCIDDDNYLDGLGGEKSYYKFNLKENNLCDHIELRWKNCQTVLPPSLHPNGNRYEFINLGGNGLPEDEPSNVWIGKLLEVLKKYCVFDASTPLSMKDEKLKTGNDEIKKVNVKRQKELKDYEKRLLKNASNFLKGKVKNYDDWLRIGFALVSLGENGRKYFIKISKGNSKYPNDKLESLNKKFDGLLRDYNTEITLGTLFHIASKYGWKPPKEFQERKKDWFEASKEYLSYYHSFKYNELTRKLIWKEKNTNEFTEFTDTDLSSIYIRLKSTEKILISYEDLKRLLNSDYVPRFNPLTQYFVELEKWDGHDYINDLAGTVICSDYDKKLWNIFLKKWLVACVAGVLSDKEINHTAIILQGAQGIGKSRWIKRLMPEKLSDYIFTGNINPNDKDSKLAVVKNFIIDLDELETLNRDEIGFLKSLMTQKEIQLRKPYGHYEEKYIRQSSFIGSVNRKDFLNDMTGSRRFLAVEVIKINAEHSVDMDKVFAQAYYLYKQSFEYWFDKEQSDEITKRNEEFTFRTIEEEKILEKFEPIEKDELGAEFLTSTEIAEKLFDEKRITNGTIKQIGMVMNKYKFKKVSKRVGNKSLKKWVVKEISNFNEATRFHI